VRAPLRDPVHRVSRRAIALWFVEAIIGFAFLLGAAIVIAYLLDRSDWSALPGWAADRVWLLPVVVGVVMLPLVVLEPLLRYAVHRWELSGDVVYARSGWLSREWVFVPVSRIQTVDKAQGWFERALRLATVEIRTASHAGSSTIKGLDYDVAAGFAEELARRAQELRDDAT
jgi:uncharacterized protein